jgi:hypothetical protein
LRKNGSGISKSAENRANRQNTENRRIAEEKQPPHSLQVIELHGDGARSMV